MSNYQELEKIYLARRQLAETCRDHLQELQLSIMHKTALYVSDPEQYPAESRKADREEWLLAQERLASALLSLLDIEGGE